MATATAQGQGRLQGRIALVTGSESGIGRASAVAFAREGASLVIDFKEDRAHAEETRQQVEAAGGRAVLVQGDMGNESDVERIFATAERELGPVTMLMQNLGQGA